MNAVNSKLRNLIIELQSCQSLNSFALAGGTNIAIRYNHRVSEDIDLFANIVVGKPGLELIQDELRLFYKESLQFCEIINAAAGDQYCFLRALIQREDDYFKVEIIQNIQFVDPIETYQGIRMLSIKDIGILKLVSASSRKARKDIYDLDLITNNIPLIHLFEQLEEKEKKFNDRKYECLFDLDNDPSPTKDISLLLEFDNINYSSLPSRPFHTNDRIEIVPPNKNWMSAKASWRRKVRELMNRKGTSLPPIKPIN